MRIEEIYFYKLILLCGYPEELNQAISTALDHQNPIESDILDLSACRGDVKKQLSVLNAILARNGEDLLDRKVIFELVRRFLHQQYVAGMDISTLVKLMYRISKETGWHDEEPWNSLFLMEDYYDDAQWGVKNRDQFLHRFARLLNFGDTKVVRTRCASISDIVDIKENRIYYREKYGNDAYIDLDSCAAFCQLMYPKQTSGLRCVGERNICGIPFYEFYDREPIRFTLYVKNNLLQRIISRMAGWNFHANKRFVLAQVLYHMALHDKTKKQIVVWGKKKQALIERLNMYHQIIGWLTSDEALQSKQCKELLEYIQNQSHSFPYVSNDILSEICALDYRIECDRALCGDEMKAIGKMVDLLQSLEPVLSRRTPCSNMTWIKTFMAFHNLPRVFFGPDLRGLWDEAISHLNLNSALESSSFFE